MRSSVGGQRAALCAAAHVPCSACSLEEHWAACHVHSLDGEPLRAMWLSVNTAPQSEAAATAGAAVSGTAACDSHDGDGALASGATGPTLPLEASQKLAHLHPLHLMQRQPRSEPQRRQAHHAPSARDAAASSSESDSDDAAQRAPRGRDGRARTRIDCYLGVVPMHEGLAAAGHLGHQLAVEVPERSVHALRWSAAGSDHASGAWRSYLLLLSDTAAMQDEHILFPNQVRHRGRALYNATPSRVLRFLADPCVSEVRADVLQAAVLCTPVATPHR